MQRTPAPTTIAINNAGAKPFRGIPPSSLHSASDLDAVAPLRKGMLGFMLAHEQFRVPHLIDLGAAAERAGFDLLATSDHFQPWQANEGHSGAAAVTLGAIAQQTRQIWLGPTVTCPTLRYHPAIVAETFASLSQIAPGRVFLGVGSGEALNERAATGAWPGWRERWDRLLEACSIIRQLWEGEHVRHHGRYYEVDARLYDAPAEPIPLLMAANGPQAMRLAGEHGDGLITDPQTWKSHREQFVEGVEISGRKLADMHVLIEHYVVVGDQRDAEAAAQLWRFGPRAFSSFLDIADPAVIERQANAEIPLHEVCAGWSIGTDAAPHIDAIEELFDSGATIVNVHSGQPDQQRVIDFYGGEILPHVRRPDSNNEA